MNNSATETILQYVEQSRSRARRAESQFDSSSRRIQRKASQDIDLFGGTATSQIAEIAGDVRRASDALYSSYQTEIQLLDDACRPLLEQKPSLEAVKAVTELIRWLNAESEINNNFTASVNHQGLGQVASVRYSPTMANQMIQRFWEAKYDSWPGRAEALAAERERRRKAEEEARIREEKRRAEKEAEERRKKEAAERERNALSQVIEKKKNEWNLQRNKMEQELRQAESAARKSIDEDQRKLTALREARGTLGIFKFSEKKELAGQISDLEGQIRDKELKLESAQNACQEKIDHLVHKIAMVSPKKGNEYFFGTQFHTSNAPMKWIVVSNDGAEVVLLAAHTVQVKSYGNGLVWLNEEFVSRVFTASEKKAMVPTERNGKSNLVVYPTSSEVNSCCRDLGTSPEEGLVHAIHAEVMRKSREYRYNALQTENSLKDNIDRASPYWLAGGGSGGFAPYVGRAAGGGGWISARIGSTASFGVRPVIRLSLSKLVDTL